MSKIVTMEDGLREMKQAFPTEAEKLQEQPILSNVFTGCKRTIRFCLIAYAQGFYYVKELMSGHSYKTKKLHYADMEIGTHYDNFTAIEGKNHQLAVQID